LPVSVSGIEIGKGLSILIFLTILVNQAVTSKGGSATHGNLFTPSRILFLAFVSSVLVSFAATSHWGDFHSGTLRQLPVVGSLLVFAGLAAFLLKRIPFSFSPAILYSLLGAMTAAFIYSLATRDGRTRGFYSHPVVYSHVLALCLTVLIFFMGSEIRKAASHLGPRRFVNLLALAVLLVLAGLDFYFNESRSLLLPLSVIPILVFFYFFPVARRKKTVLAAIGLTLLLLTVLSALLVKTKQFEKVLHHVHFYYRIPTQASFQAPRFETFSNHPSQTVLEGQVANGSKPIESKIHFQYIPSMFEGDEALVWNGSSFLIRFPLTNIDRPQAFYIEWHLPVDLHGKEGSFRKTTHEKYFFSYDPNENKSPKLFWSESRIGIERGSKEFAVEKSKLGLLALVKSFRFTLFEDIRAWIWRSSALMISQGPLFGVGPGNWGHAAKEFRFNPASPVIDRLTALNGGIFHSHNNFLTVAVEFGIP
ncbi:MAG: O-antigen ligase family protein, partial [Spirochaetia bacterium]|nr:O-antigen ligase family protein [Spirochaetia bacterium]